MKTTPNPRTRFAAITAALLPFYEQRQLLKRVDGVGSMEEVTVRINNAIER